MCECKKQMEDALRLKFLEKYPNTADGAVCLQGYGYTFHPDGRAEQLVVMKAEYTATHPLKKGGVKRKTVVAQVAATYCPFCGSKFE